MTSITTSRNTSVSNTTQTMAGGTNRAVTFVSLLAFTVASCGFAPDISVDDWSIDNSASPRSIHIVGKYANASEGNYHGSLYTLDEFGCRTEQYIDFVEPRGSDDPFNFKLPVKSVGDIIEANLSVRFWDVSSDIGERSEAIFDDQKTFGDLSKIPSVPTISCQIPENGPAVDSGTSAETKDATAIDAMSREEVVATAINTAGYLCARVTIMSASGGNIDVECIEYRDGSGRVSYRIDTSTMTVTPR